MSGTIAENAGRGDILLQRGITNRLAVTWQCDQGGGFQPMDLTDHECRFVMYTAGAPTPAYARLCDAHGVDGVAAVYIPPEAFADPLWASRVSGTWRMTASRGGVTDLLGSGYWHLA
jgi:hypothetical protein